MSDHQSTYISSNSLPGKRVDLYLAGITPIIFGSFISLILFFFSNTPPLRFAAMRETAAKIQLLFFPFQHKVLEIKVHQVDGRYHKVIEHCSLCLGMLYATSCTHTDGGKVT